MVYEKDKIRRLIEYKDKITQSQIKNDLEWILELKQLETILDQLNLKDVINDELRQGGLFLSIKNKLLGEKK